MAQATMAEIREGLRAALVAGLGATAQTVSAYMKSNPSPRHVQVMGPDVIEYDELMQRGLDRWTIIVQAFSGSPEDVAAQTRLDGWLAGSGATSVKAAIEADITLGGKVKSARVVRSSGYREYDAPNRTKILWADFSVDIFN